MLFVFDDIVLHSNKERHIFNLAYQPFAPFNICNEIRENTGIFKNTHKNYELTTIFVADTESSNLQFL
jgi:hypothetical protein